jgi:hypothetical protein
MSTRRSTGTVLVVLANWRIYGRCERSERLKTPPLSTDTLSQRINDRPFVELLLLMHRSMLRRGEKKKEDTGTPNKNTDKIVPIRRPLFSVHKFCSFYSTSFITHYFVRATDNCSVFLCRLQYPLYLYITLRIVAVQ